MFTKGNKENGVSFVLFLTSSEHVRSPNENCGRRTHTETTHRTLFGLWAIDASLRKLPKSLAHRKKGKSRILTVSNTSRVLIGANFTAPYANYMPQIT